MYELRDEAGSEQELAAALLGHWEQRLPLSCLCLEDDEEWNVLNEAAVRHREDLVAAKRHQQYGGLLDLLDPTFVDLLNFLVEIL